MNEIDRLLSLEQIRVLIATYAISFDDHDWENAIVARYHDTFVRRGGRWLFARREETPLQYKPGPPRMSETAVGVSGATMRTEGA